MVVRLTQYNLTALPSIIGKDHGQILIECAHHSLVSILFLASAVSWWFIYLEALLKDATLSLVPAESIGEKY